MKTVDIAWNCDPWQLLANWPQAESLFFVRSQGGRLVRFALAGNEISEKTLAGIALDELSKSKEYDYSVLGVVSYDRYSLNREGVGCRYFQINRWLNYDLVTHKTWLQESESLPCPSDWEIDLKYLRRLSALPTSDSLITMDLLPMIDDDEYREKVEMVRSDIRRGRYYQLNFLRYYRLRQIMSPLDLAERLRVYGGNYSCWLRWKGRELISFSPEQFVCFHANHRRDVYASAYPIKGTIERSENAAADAKYRENLCRSRKDRAELSMIVDLMRNDLRQISEPGSVSVEHFGVIPTKTLYHMQACVQAKVAKSAILANALEAICPAGSITGAPKREVMAAIAELEGRPRGYFMGNVFTFDTGIGKFDSSVLIRTIVKEQQYYEYAAGSGITIFSDPQKELEEVRAKCRVLTEQWPKSQKTPTSVIV